MRLDGVDQLRRCAPPPSRARHHVGAPLDVVPVAPRSGVPASALRARHRVGREDHGDAEALPLFLDEVGELAVIGAPHGLQALVELRLAQSPGECALAVAGRPPDQAMVEPDVRSAAFHDVGVDVRLGAIEVDDIARCARHEDSCPFRHCSFVERVDVEVRIARDGARRCCDRLEEGRGHL